MAATSRLPAWARAKDIADLIRLSVPIAVSRMAMMLMGLTDAIVLGRYAPEELAYVLSAWLPIGVSLGFGIGILLGVQVLTSRLLGIGRRPGQAVSSGGALVGHRDGRRVDGRARAIAAPFFHFVFVTIAPASPEAAAAAVTRTRGRVDSRGHPHPGLRPDRPYDLAGLLLLSGGAAPPAAGHHRHVCGRCDQHLRQPGAGQSWWGFPQMGAEGVAWATTGTRWMIAAIMLIFVAALTPASAGLRLRRRKRVFSSKSEPAPPFPTSPNGAVSTSPSSSPPGLHRGQRCLWLFGAGDGRVLHVLSRHRHGHIRARGRRLSGGAIGKR